MLSVTSLVISSFSIVTATAEGALLVPLSLGKAKVLPLLPTITNTSSAVMSAMSVNSQAPVLGVLSVMVSVNVVEPTS